MSSLDQFLTAGDAPLFQPVLFAAVLALACDVRKWPKTDCLLTSDKSGKIIKRLRDGVSVFILPSALPDDELRERSSQRELREIYTVKDWASEHVDSFKAAFPSDTSVVKVTSRLRS